MKHKILPVLFLLMAASQAHSLQNAPPSTTTLAEGNTAFALSLYAELATGKGNLLFSPYSVSTAMGMVWSGARANTATEIKTALHFQVEQQQLPGAIKTLTGHMLADASNDNQKLSIANALCLTHGNVSEDYKKLLKEQYNAGIFHGDLDAINGWVKKQTEGKIDKILTKLDINSVCVILNAIYFKGTWENQFKKSDTRDASFNVSTSSQVTVPFMRQSAKYRMIENQDFQAISIPYSGNRLSMVILLPTDVDGLDKLEKQLAADKLKQWLAELDATAPQKIELLMPKYTMDCDHDLIPPCKDLGIKDAFDGAKADFGGMGWAKGMLWIVQIKHRAFLEVNEEGSEAAAATAVELKTRGAYQELVFRADHPFLFIIRHNETGTILFMGRVVDPHKGT